MLQRWSSKSREYVIQLGRNAKSYIKAHSLNERASIDYIKEWIRNIREVIKSIETYDGDNIRKFITKMTNNIYPIISAWSRNL